MRLLIDVGNSRCKYARVDAGAVVLCDAVPTADVGYALRRSLDGHLRRAPQSVHVASVAGDECNARVAQAVRTAFGGDAPDAVFLAPALPACGVTTRYRAGQLGVDRCLALIAAWRRCNRSCIVADCGTAMTLDYLDGDGLHHGGVILPGAGLLHDALRRRTYGLRRAACAAASEDGASKEAPSEGGVFATATDEAVAAGCRRVVDAGIESIIRDMRARRDADAPLVLTGGAARTLAVFGNCVAAPNLVLEGIAIVAESLGWGRDDG